MLSTDSAVCLIRGTSRALDARIASTSHEELCISAVTRGELLCGLSLQTLQTLVHEPTPEEAQRSEITAKNALKKVVEPPTVGRRTRRLYVRVPKQNQAAASLPIDHAALESLRSTTHAALAKLTPREAQALRERFGIHSNAEHSLEEVSRQFDLTRERIRHHEQTQDLSRLVDQFLARVSCVPWDEIAATHFATVAVELQRIGTPIGTTDAMIAGHAIAVGAVLITNNEQRFSSVRGLKTENWTRRRTQQ
jgi:predicted nucleic acid-binding protein